MESSEVQTQLLELKSYLAGSTITDSVARGFVESVHASVEQCAKESFSYDSAVDRGVVCSYVFDADTGLLGFLRTQHDLPEARVEALRCIGLLLNRVGKEATVYIKDVKEVCVCTFRQAGNHAKIKAEATAVLIEVFRSAHGDGPLVTALDIPELVTFFFKDVFSQSAQARKPPTVLRQLYELMGLLCHLYPMEVGQEYVRKLNLCFTNDMKTQMSKPKKADLTVVAGCFLGFTGYLYNFAVPDDPSLSQWFVAAKRLISAFRNDTLSRYEALRALKLLTEHAVLFAKYFFEEYADIFDDIRACIDHSNTDVKHGAFTLLDAFLLRVADQLEQEQKKNMPHAQLVFDYFFKHFHKELVQPTPSRSQTRGVAIAVKGFGIFAKPCRVIGTPERVSEMFFAVADRCEQLFLNPQENLDDKLSYLPNFLSSFAYIAANMDELPDAFIACVAEMHVLLLHHQPLLDIKYHARVCEITHHVFLAMFPKAAHYIRLVLYKSMILMCSYDPDTSWIVADDELGTSGETRNTRALTFEDYLPMWVRLMQVNAFEMQELGATGGFTKEHINAVLEAAYDATVTAVMELCAKLDLNTTARSDTEHKVAASALSANLRAIAPRDCMVFANVVAFARKFYLEVPPTYFGKWVWTFAQLMAGLSMKLQAQSGFYTLLAVCATLCKKLAYFDTKSPTMTLHASEQRACFQLFTKFSEEVVVRTKLLKDEILVASLRFVLSLPYEVVENNLSAIMPGVQRALSFGLDFLPLAVLCIDALEDWMQHIEAAKLGDFMKNIVPFFRPYLESVQSTQGSRSTVSSLSRSKLKAKQRVLKGRKRPPQTSGGQAGISDDTTLEEVKLRILVFLGSGQYRQHLMREDADEMNKHCIRWDKDDRLSFAVPFEDLKPEIHLDHLLPRVCELACSAGPRQTVVAACELLHALTLYMLGKTTQGSDEQQLKYPMSKLYRHVFPCLLRLACHTDNVVRQLFSLLVPQLIHWYTGNKTFEHPETMSLLDSIFEGLVDSDDAGLRDYCAECVREFLLWSVKRSQLGDSKALINSKSVFKRIYSSASHPNAFRRLGAALAFNAVYRVFREEENLVNVYTIELFASFLDSLISAEKDNENLGTAAQASEALDHLLRIILKKRDLLTKSSRDRRVPIGWKDATYADCVENVWRICACTEAVARRKCLGLLDDLCQVEIAANSGTQVKARSDFFIEKHSTLGSKGLVKFVESGAGQNGGIAHTPTLKQLSRNEFNLCSVLDWLDCLLAALDVYCQLVDHRVPLDSLLLESQESRLFESLGYFIEYVAFWTLGKAGAPVSVDDRVFSPAEQQRFTVKKCTVLVRVLELLETVLTKYVSPRLKFIPDNFWSEPLWRMLLAICFDPEQLGFNTVDFVVAEKLSDIVRRVMFEVGGLVPGPGSKFAAFLKTMLPKDYPLPKDILKNAHADVILLTFRCNGYRLLHAAKLLPKEVVQASADMIDQVMHHGFQQRGANNCVAVHWQPTQKAFAAAMLALGFEALNDPNHVLCLLMDTSKVSRQGARGVLTLKGRVICDEFASVLSVEVVKAADKCVAACVAKLPTSGTFVIDQLTVVAEHVIKDRRARQQFGSKFVIEIREQWMNITNWLRAVGGRANAKLAVLSLMGKLFLIDSRSFADISKPAFRHVFECYTKVFLLADEVEMAFRVKVLDLLPFFVLLPKKEFSIEPHLLQFTALYFPQRMSDLEPGTTQYCDYLRALHSLLRALEVTASPILLRMLIRDVFCRDSNPLTEDFQLSLRKLFRSKRNPLSADRQHELVNCALDIFLSDNVAYQDKWRRNCVEQICLPMLQAMPQENVKTYFQKELNRIFPLLMEQPLREVSNDRVPRELVRRMGAFRLLETFFRRLSLQDVVGHFYAVYEVLEKSRGGTLEKTLQLKVTKLCSEALNTVGDRESSEMWYDYRCAAFCCLTATLICTQTKEEMFTGLLFKSKVWDSIVDPSRTYSFPVDVDAAWQQRKQRLMHIRRELRKFQSDGTNEGMEAGYSALQMLSSQFLADTTLSQDTSQYDYTSSVQSTSDADDVRSSKNIKLANNSTAAGDDETMSGATAVKVGDLELEPDELNRHPCMEPFVRVIRFLIESNITIIEPDGTGDMPRWMRDLHTKLDDVEAGPNIKLLIARIVTSLDVVFRPYARFWLGPMLKLAAADELNRQFGHGVHEAFIEWVAATLSWHKVAVPERIHADSVCRVLRFVMQNIKHENSAVTLRNLELAKMMIVVWQKTIVWVDTGVLKDLMTPGSTGPKDRTSAIGVKLLGFLLANQINPYGGKAVMLQTAGEQVTQQIFYKTLLSNVEMDSKLVYGPASEVVGIVLKYFEDPKLGRDFDWKGFHDGVQHVLQRLKTKNNDMFLHALEHMQLHYPKIVDGHMDTLLMMLPRLHGVSKTEAWQCVASRIDQRENVYAELLSKDILGLLNTKDDMNQVVALRVILKALQSLKPHEVFKFLPDVCALVHHGQPQCRRLVYDIAKMVYLQYNESKVEHIEELRALCVECLLHGLQDHDPLLKQQNRGFWSDESVIPRATIARLPALVRMLYHPNTEDNFLANVLYLLLERTANSPDYYRFCFEKPLNECKFAEYKLKNYWRDRYSTLETPLFAETQRNTVPEFDFSSLTASAAADGGEVQSAKLRATAQVPEFTATQAAGMGATFDWVTGQSFNVDTFAPDALDTLRSSLDVSMAANDDASRPFAFRRPAKRTYAAREGAVEDEESREMLLRLKRRIWRDKQSSSAFFAQIEARRKRARVQRDRQRRMERDSKVHIFRSYRIGDVPDIQIAPSAIIAPLQALADRDPDVSKQLFVALVVGVCREMRPSQLVRADKVTTFFEQLSAAIQRVFDESISYNGQVMRALQLVCYNVLDTLQPCPDARAISNAAEQSLQPNMGILLLEKCLLRADDNSSEPSAKRKRANKLMLDPNEKLWIELARLYKCVDEADVMRSILHDKLDVGDAMRVALEADTQCRYADAEQGYEEALRRLHDQTTSASEWRDSQQEFLLAARLQCLEQLGNWKSMRELSSGLLANIVEASSNNDTTIFPLEYYTDDYFPWQLESNLKMLVSERIDNQESTVLQSWFQRLTQDADRSSEKKGLLERHAKNLAVWNIVTRDFDRARYHCDLAMRSFLQSWAQLSVFVRGTHAAKLDTLQPLCEMKEYLDFVKASKAMSMDAVERICKRWLQQCPSLLSDCLPVWGETVLNRRLYVEYLTNQLVKDRIASDTRVCDFARTFNGELGLQFVHVAHRQRNFDVAAGELLKIRQVANSEQWAHAYADVNLGRSETLTPAEALECLAVAVGQLEQRTDVAAKVPGKVLLARLLSRMGDICQSPGFALSQLPINVSAAVLHRAGMVNKNNVVELVAALWSRAYTLHQEAAKMSDNTQDHLALAQFCDKLLRTKEEHNFDVSNVGKSADEDACMLMRCVLVAMRSGDAQACNMFPRLLQLLKRKAAAELFQQECAALPTWMFLHWVSQLLALLDKPDAEAVQSVVQRIADEYPRAIVYALKLSSSGYMFATTTDQRRRRFVQALQEQLDKLPLVNQLVAALQLVVSGESIISDMFKDLREIIRQDKEFSAMCERYWKQLIDVPKTEGSKLHADDLMPKPGSYHVLFAKAAEKQLGEWFGDKFSKLIDAKDKEGKQRKDMLSCANEDFKKRAVKIFPEAATNLHEYCPWLANFSSHLYGSALELPGQYTGLAKPLPEYHVKVAGFDSKVTNMSSMRRPKAIKIRGDDEREYKYLVKGGEDLRQDQRIMQLFSKMNDIFATDPACVQHGFHIRTYVVLPLTPQLGLLEFVPNTKTLKECLIGKEDPNEWQKRCLHKLHAAMSKTKYLVDYFASYTQDDHAVVGDAMRKVQRECMPWDCLRQYLQALCVGPEAFFCVRGEYAKSLAVMSMAGYVLGIGDRHLDNIMVDLSAGTLVGIDFGHAFGTGTTVLPCPELVPFRLTPQLVNVLRPLDVRIALQPLMVHCWRALCAHKHQLLGLMDIFVKEPLVDWQDHAKRQAKYLEREHDMQKLDWYPLEKLKIARRKLDGHNPVVIMCDELWGGVLHKLNLKVCERAWALLYRQNDSEVKPGFHGSNNIRGYAQTGLTIEQQVDVLIDLATDCNVLARLYRGWTPWA